MPILFFLLSLFMSLFPTMAWAASEPLDMPAALLRTAWALLVVIGLILAIYGLSKKRLFLGKFTGNTAITIIEIRALQPRSTLALVEVRGREYLLGVTANSSHLLAELTDEPQRQQTDFSTFMTEQQ